MDDGAFTSSTLQHLLTLAISENPEDQQKAAVDLAKLVNGSVFPAYSYGPLSHALCKLIPSNNRTVASYSARALKILLLDDALRSLTVGAGIPAVVCTAIQQWEDEILCLRELLGALQTLTWDKQCVKSVLQADVISNLILYATVRTHTSSHRCVPPSRHTSTVSGHRPRGLRARAGHSGQHTELLGHAAAGQRPHAGDPGLRNGRAGRDAQGLEPETPAFVCRSGDSECLVQPAAGGDIE